MKAAAKRMLRAARRRNYRARGLSDGACKRLVRAEWLVFHAALVAARERATERLMVALSVKVDQILRNIALAVGLVQDFTDALRTASVSASDFGTALNQAPIQEAIENPDCRNGEAPTVATIEASCKNPDGVDAG